MADERASSAGRLDREGLNYRHRSRVIVCLLVASAVWLASRYVDLPPDIGSGSRRLAIGLLITAYLLVLAMVVVGPLLRRPWGLLGLAPSALAQTPGSTWSRRGAIAARWATLLLLLPPAAYFGDRASLPEGDILRLELVGTHDEADKLMGSPGALDRAISADWGFIGAYVLLLALLAAWAGCFYRLEAVRRMRWAVVSCVVAAGLLDVGENLMLRQVHETGDKSTSKETFVWDMIATCAWSKFALLALALVFIVGGVHSWLFTPRWVRLAAWQIARPEEGPQRTTDDSADRAAPAGHADHEPSGPGPRESKHLGIALSGGGIRAASISLGALQVLERHSDNQPALGWEQARTVTAVSGGSNMAAGLSISRSTWQPQGSEGSGEGTVQLPWSSPDDEAKPTPEEEHLIKNLGYLASRSPRGKSNDQPGAPDKVPSYVPTAYATLLTGLLVNVFVLLLILWLIARPIGWLLMRLNGGPMDGGEFHDLVWDHDLMVPGLSLLAVGLLVLILWVLLGQIPVLQGRVDSLRRMLMNALRLLSYGLLGLGAALVAVLWAYPEIAGFFDFGSTEFSLGAVTGAAGLVGAVVRTVKVPAARIAPWLGGVLFVVLVLGAAGYMTSKAAAADLHWGWVSEGQNSGLPWLIAAILLVLLQLLVSPERWSLAAFYRGKLRAAYATHRDPHGPMKMFLNDNATNDASEREPDLSAYRDATGAPLTPLVVCATSTVTTRAVKTHYGIPALSVTFDPNHVVLQVSLDQSGDAAHYRACTRVMSRIGRVGGKRVSTMLPVAISSAAVSPAMGRVRVGPARMLLAFANVRLGVWMPNPRYVSVLQTNHAAACAAPDGDEANPRVQVPPELQQEKPLAHHIGYARTGLGYLFKELFGVHDLTDPFLYMTDGGHWENTGLVELIRSKEIHEVICIDADSGPLDAATSLGKALDLAPLECGAKLQVNLEPLRATDEHTNAPAFSQRTVALGVLERPDDAPGTIGLVWYAKPGLTRDMPPSLLGYRETHHDFPTISTMNQFFDVSTYVAYRDLGRYNAAQIRNARRELLAILETDLHLGDATEPTDDAVRDKLKRIAEDTERHWVAQEVRHLMHFRAEEDQVAFLKSIRLCLRETTPEEVDVPERAGAPTPSMDQG